MQNQREEDENVFTVSRSACECEKGKEKTRLTSKSVQQRSYLQ